MHDVTLARWTDMLAADARRRRDVPEALTLEASRITRRSLAELAGRPLTPRDRRRVAAYWNAVVRRRVLRGADGRRAASRAVLATVVADLRAAGRDAASIAEELERAWSETVPSDLLEEYKLRLCG